ncbi:MAG: molybdopterin molybdenumtransferase MoeA [Bradyrhizobiaceae bacterium]|nr:MAG: molybdopterin molybdenumtransferase MoeA [Bradyrhizobiaceae bacterium]
MKSDRPRKTLTPVADALAAVLAGAQPLGEETADLWSAHHRTLSRDVPAARTQPPADMSAMDGYAVRFDDAKKDARLTVIGEAAAGAPFGKTLNDGEAVRIFTGGVVPPGANHIVIQENVTRDGDTIVVNVDAATPRHIRHAGIDFREGDVLLKKGTRLNDRALSLAASMNHPALPVYRRPKVALLATGDELVMPGEKAAPGQIVFSNAYALRALAESEGAQTIDLGLARDTVEDTARAIRKAVAAKADILISTGGASVGDHDVVKRALESEGVEMTFWQIALRPGKPMMNGHLGPMRVIGVPGNPVSSYVCTYIFGVPLIRALSGRSEIHHVMGSAILAHDLPGNDHRQEYLRARLAVREDGLETVAVIGNQDSSLLGNLAAANALIVRAPDAPAAKAGERCDVLRLPG